MPSNTNFIVNINGQNADLGTLINNWSTNTINIPATGTTLGSYSINYSSPTLIRETDITVAMDGQPLNGDQVYTFGPLIQNKTLLVGTAGTNYAVSSNDSVVFNGLGSSQANGLVIWDGIKWIGVNNITVSISYNGTNWQTVATLTNATGNATKINYNGKIYLISFYTQGGNNMAYSYDGINWNLTYSQITVTYSVTWNGSFWLGSGTTAGGNSFSFSPDGITWTGITPGVASLGAVCWNGSYWIIIRDRILINTNPSGQGTWTTISCPIFPNYVNSQRVFTIAWNGKTMIATGNYISDGVGNTFAYSNDGITWTGLGPIIYQNQLTGGYSAWNGKVFISCYNSATIGNSFATSYNGINWIGQGTISRPGEIGINTRRLNSVTFQRNMTIVFGGTNTNGNIMAYSLDGINYKACNASFHSKFEIYYYTPHGIDYSGKLWVSLSYNNIGNVLAASRDGINWYGLGQNILVGAGVFWLGNRWFGGSGSYYSYSYDGLTWIPVYNPGIFTDWRTFAYNGSIYVAGGSGPYSFAYSYNGINWTGVPNTSAVFGKVWNIVTNGKIFISTGDGILNGANGNYMGYSYDGITWTPIPTTTGYTYTYSVATNGTMFVATGSVPNGGYAYMGYSYNGINWYAVYLGSGIWYNVNQSRPNSVIWNGTMWVMVGGSAGGGIGYSYDGINWFNSPQNRGSIFTGNAFLVGTNYGVNPKPFIQHPTLAFGSGTNTIAYSPDGITWTGLGTTVFSTAGYCGFWSGSFWVAGGQGGNTMAYSYDGIQWSSITNNVLFASVQGITYNGVIWVATGTAATGGNSAAYSTDGLNWTGMTITGLTSGSSVYWNGTVFMLISNVSGLAYHSTDGKVWSQSTSSTLNGIPASNGQTWVICNRSNATSSLYYVNISNPVTTSYTAVSPNPFSTSGNCVCYGGFIWLAGGIGTTNTLAYSNNGTTWTGLGKTAFPTVCSSICWNGKRYVGAGGNYIGYSPDGINWYSGQTGLFTGINYVVSNPGIGAFVPPSAMVLNNNGITGNGLYSSTTLEVVSSDPYFQNGFTNVSFNITSNSIY